MTYAKIVDCSEYHLWSDALHGRALAHQAMNQWDRGTYVRWTVMTAWTVLEMACGNALAKGGIGRSFKRNLDQAVHDLQLPPIDWSQGTWQLVTVLQMQRKAYVHLNAKQDDLFPTTAAADLAIHVTREAVTDIYRRASKPVPAWLQDDSDRGFDVRPPVSAHACVIRAGADSEAPDTIRIVYVRDGSEYVTEYLPADTDPIPHVDALVGSLNVPVSAVRAYRGTTLLVDRPLRLRGT